MTMVLKFSGGVKLPEQSKIKDTPFLKTVGNCRVGIEVSGKTELAFREGDFVSRGTHFANMENTPIFAPVAGVFEGVIESNGRKYLAIKNSGETDEVRLFNRETKPISEMDFEYITERARRLSVFDSRSGSPLWKMLKNAESKIHTVVIDCTETDPLSATGERLCVEKTKSLIGGAKLILKAIGASKIVFALESNKKSVAKSLSENINDENLCFVARLDRRYPYTDVSIVRALFVKDIAVGETAVDKGVFIVGAETAIAIYDAFLEGIPQLERYITVCDEDGNGFNLKVPKGIAIEPLIVSAKFKSETTFSVINSRINGYRATRFLSENARTVISVEKKEESVFDCISCGKCVEVCPVGLYPFRVIGKWDETLTKHCIGCGCCEYICDSKIPLLKMIKGEKAEVKK